MIALLNRLRAVRTAEDGFTLIEVVVAIMIFSVIAIGVAYTITNSMTFSRESASREVAINLASQEIDLDRSINDVFSITNSTWNKTINNVTYHVTRSTAWVAAGGSGGGACGSNGGTLQFKQINISVTWDGMSSRAAAVHDDTVVAPNSRINDPTLGTIIISATSASGGPTAGVGVSAQPSNPANGAASLATQPPATDNQGCSYALKVTPGNYDVTLSQPGYIDVTQDTTPTDTVGVAAGASAPAPFTYDLGVTYNLTYAPGLTGFSIPTNLQDTFRSSSSGNFTMAVAGSSQLLFPFTGGYTTVAGVFQPAAGTNAGCINTDPASWTTRASDGAVGAPLAPPAQNGLSANATVGMGGITVSGLTSGRYVTAVSQNAPNAAVTGDPGCSVSQVYNFPQNTSSAAKLALPFGTWRIYQGTSAGSTTTLIGASQVSLATRGTTNALQQMFTLDPRTVS